MLHELSVRFIPLPISAARKLCVSQPKQVPGKISVDQILITTLTLDIYTPNMGIAKPNVDSKPYFDNSTLQFIPKRV